MHLLALCEGKGGELQRSWSSLGYVQGAAVSEMPNDRGRAGDAAQFSWLGSRKQRLPKRL